LAVFGFEATQAGAWGVAVSRAVLAYTAFTMGGMMLFGSRRWLDQVEVFDRVFAWWSTMAPVEVTERGLRMVSPVDRLANATAKNAGDASFLVALLYGVNFDGFLSTQAGQGALEPFGFVPEPAAKALVLVAGFFVFLAVFWGTVAAVRWAAGSLRSVASVGSRVAVALVPIAAGYHLAHAGPDVLLSSPLLFEAVLDPLALGTATATPITLSSTAQTVLLGVEATIIVAAHVLAVLAGHRVAYSAFASRVQAVKSELPVTLLMVAYTFAGLWLVARAGIPAGVTG
jgi:hypothetical protein